MNIKVFLITVVCTALLTAGTTYFLSKHPVFYDPLNNPEVLKLKHETDLRDSLNNEIIEILKDRIEDKQYIIDNMLRQVIESKNRIKHYSSKKDEEIKYINSLDEIQLQNDINTKLKNRSN